MASRPSAKKSRLRRSGILKTLAMASRNFITVDSLVRFLLYRFLPQPAALTLGRALPGRNDFRDSAGRLNLFDRGLGKHVRLDGDLARQFARGQNLEAMAELLDHAQFDQVRR